MRMGISLLVCVLIASATPSFAQRYQQTKNVVYAEAHGVGLVMDIFEPKKKKNGLAVIDVISGGWSSSRGKIGDHKLAQMFNIFCERGYTVFAIRPGSLSKFTGEEMLDHLFQGIAWVKEHAGDYEIDPDRLGLTGASAGGHLASLAAVRAEEAKHRVACVAVFFPPTDLLAFAEASDSKEREVDVLLQALGRTMRTIEPEQTPLDEVLRKLSPALMVSGDEPPFLLIHGDADPVVPLEQSERLLKALKEEDVSAELIVKKGGAHPWLTIPVEVAKLADWMDVKLTKE